MTQCRYLLARFFHRWLLQSECRTTDASAADFFFVPVYAACVMTRRNVSATEMDAHFVNKVTPSKVERMVCELFLIVLRVVLD